MSETIFETEDVLFIGNLPYSILDSELQALAAEYGEIASVSVVRDERERSRGFGFIRYSSPEDAKNAHQNLDGKEIDGRNLRASFARTDSRYIEVLND